MMQINADAVQALAEMGPLRIVAEEIDDEVELEIEAADEPSAGDQVVSLGAATVFLDPLAAEALADQVLGVEGHDDHYHFTFAPQDAD
jgi:F420-dependent methylenetetrahydromethanopterin dehydrogenase